MAMKEIFVVGLLLVSMIFTIGCLEKGGSQATLPSNGDGPTTVIETAAEENVLSVESKISPSGDEPTGPFKINMALSEVPILNKPVELTITATTYVKGREFPNVSIGLMLRKYDPTDYEGYYNVYRRLRTDTESLWTGTIRHNETVIAKHTIRLNETGYFAILGAVVTSNGAENFAGLFPNITEKSTHVSRQPYYLPPPPSEPERPYIIHITLHGTPRLNTTAELEVTIASMVEEKDANFTVILPDGVELVNGDLTWTGELKGRVPEDINTLLGNVTAPQLWRQNKSVPGEIIARSNLLPTDMVKIRSRVKFIQEGDLCFAVVPFVEPLPPIECSYDIPVVNPDTDRRGYSLGGTLHARVGQNTGEISEAGFPKTPITTTPPLPKSYSPESPAPTTLQPNVTPAPPEDWEP